MSDTTSNFSRGGPTGGDSATQLQRLQSPSKAQIEMNHGSDQTYFAGRADDKSSLLSLPLHHQQMQMMNAGKVPQSPLLLLKPNGAPVFQSIDTNSNHNQSTIDQTFYNINHERHIASTGDGFHNQSTNSVRAHSFVMGKRIENITAINLLTAESAPQPGEEKHMPIKVIYQKPASQPRPNSTQAGYQAPSGTVQFQAPLKVKKSVNSAKSKERAPSTKTEEQKPKASIKIVARPKSATSSSIPKAEKLTAKPKKLAQSKEQPNQEQKNANTDIPFSGNRLKGQFENITPNLFKNAQKLLLEKKIEEQRKKEEHNMKKEQQKMIAEEIKLKNQQMVMKQREKGAEHIDFRKKEEEAKEMARKAENKAEREKQKEIREKRKAEGRKLIGLDILQEDAIEEYRKQVKDTLQAEVKPIVAKGGIIAPISNLARPKSSNPQGKNYLDQLNNNSDILQFIQKQEKVVEEDPEAEQFKEQEQKRIREELLKEQKRKRKERQLEEQLKTDMEQRKKEENMKKLKEELARQKVENLKRQQEQLKVKEEQEKLKQLEKEMREQERKARFSKKIKLNNSSKGGEEASQIMSHEEQLADLHDWIDDQINKDKYAKSREKDPDAFSPPRVKNVQISQKKNNLPPRASSAGSYSAFNKAGSSSHNTSAMEDIIDLSYDKRNDNLLSQQPYQAMVPGNSELDYSELQKFGNRQNRYGIFGDNGYQEVVEIKKRPVAKIEVLKKKPAQEDDMQKLFSKDGILSVMEKINEQYMKEQQQQRKPEQDGLSSPQKLVGQERRILNEIHKQYMLNFKEEEIPGREEPLVQIQSVPGVINIQQEVERQKRDELAQKTKATIVIQKWTRGFLARHLTRKIRERRQREIEVEYGYFEDRVKFNTQYNLQKFIRDKQALREKNKTKSVHLAESASISERIGESSSMGQRVQIMSKISHGSRGGSHNQQRKSGKENFMLNNFFPQTTTTVRDSNSIVNIFIQQQLSGGITAPKPAVVQSPVKQIVSAAKKQEQQQLKPPAQQKKKAAPQNTKAEVKPKRRLSHSSDIIEDIISEDIPNEDNNSFSNKSNEGSIEEDIPIESGASGDQSHSKEHLEKEQKPFQSLRNHKPFNYRMQSSISESIQEDIILSVDKKSPFKKGDKHEDNSSIIEESHLLMQSKASSGGQQNKRGGSSIDESINESVPSGSAGQSGSSSMVIPQKSKVAQKTQHEIEKEKTMEQIRKFEEDRKADQEKREKLMSELVGELNRYESTTEATLVVERMEKIISKSLAQKDHILLAQRMHELEQEKKHKEEIARIREEQIKLLAQLILAGGFQGGQTGAPGTMSEQERKDLIDNVMKAIEKPVVISSSAPATTSKKRHSAPNQNSFRDSQSIRESIQLDNIQESRKEHSSDEGISEDILPEADDSNISREGSDDIKESLHPSGGDEEIKSEIEDDSIKEESQLANVRRVMGSEKDVRAQSKKVLEDANSGQNKKKNESGLFSKNSFHDFQEKKFKEFILDGAATGPSLTFFRQIEDQLDTFKETAQRELDLELKRNVITPRTYKKKGEEIEKWAEIKRHDLHKQMEPIQLQMKAIMDNLKKDKDSIIERIGVSPRVDYTSNSRRKDSSSLDYEQIDQEESNESLNTKVIRDQIQKLAKRDNFLAESVDPLEASESAKFEMKVKKKKALAKKLLEEKEKAIKRGLKDKMREIEADQADKMAKVALNLDPSKEIERRLKDMRRHVEESSETFNNLESARSNAISQSGAGAASESMGKKKVQFASPDKYRSSAVEDASSLSNKYSNNKFEDSIGESISIVDSYQQSMSHGAPSSSNNQHQSAPAANSSFDKRGGNKPLSIQESINESSNAGDEDYSENFEQSAAGISNKTPSKNQLSSYAKSVTESSAQIEEDYSQNFDESIQPKIGEKSIKSSIPEITVRDEDEEEPVVSSSNAHVEVIGHEAAASENQDEEEIDGTLSYQTSSQVPELKDPLLQSSEDHEVVNSSHSIEWHVQLSEKKTRQITEEDKSEQNYSQEDFQSEQLSDPEPDIDIEALADAFTEEYFQILVADLRENTDEMVIGVQHDESEFEGRYPFDQQAQEEDKVEVHDFSSPQIKAKVVEIPRKNEMEAAREKYEGDLKQLQEQFNEQVRYIEMLIQHINKDELIAALERPIEVDPLKKLAFIFSQEQDESHNNQNETINGQSLLSLDYFIEMEDEHKRSHQYENSEDEQKERFTQYSHKALFDAFNQALDSERPYKEKGQPAPWSKQTRVVKKKITERMVDHLLQKSKEKVLTWCKTGAGTKLAPVPAAPPQSEENNNLPPPVLAPEADRINGLREVRIGLLMIKETEENEEKWIDYEDEDTQVKFDLADMILDVLASEVSQYLYTKSGTQ